MPRNKANFLDYVPRLSTKNDWILGKDRLVTVHKVNTGFFAFLAQRIFSRPRISKIALDSYGSFLWVNMDGQKNVAALARILQSEYGTEAEPLYKRLVHYLKVLHNNDLIILEKRSDHTKE